MTHAARGPERTPEILEQVQRAVYDSSVLYLQFNNIKPIKITESSTYLLDVYKQFKLVLHSVMTQNTKCHISVYVYHMFIVVFLLYCLAVFFFSSSSFAPLLVL